MNAIPAIVAGVDEVAMVVPPAADGTVNPYTLAAAAEAGVDEIYKVGGAQAVAALAYGTASIARVDKIVGPGNAYVTAAKKLVMGDVGIDMLAGPERSARARRRDRAVPAFVAIDLMAQAEHDPRAATYLVTTDPELPALVEEALAQLLAESPRGEITARSLADNGVVVVCPDIVAALDTVDLIAPEHLEVQMAEPFDLLGSIRNAGAIFLGQWTPESVGDYVGRAQPRAADRRDGALLEPAVGRRLREEVERALVQLRGAGDGRRRRCSPSPRRRGCGPTAARCGCGSKRWSRSWTSWTANWLSRATSPSRRHPTSRCSTR